MSTKINEDSMKRALNGEMSMKEFRSLTPLIDKRFIEIVNYVYNKLGAKIDWFDYGNMGNGDDDASRGYFDSVDYKDFVSFFVELDRSSRDLDLNDFKYFNEFPTSWLSNDYKDEADLAIKEWKDKLRKELDDKKEEEKQRKQKEVQQLNNIPHVSELQNSILSKLSKEEMAVLKFKNFSEIDPELSLPLVKPSLPKNAKEILDKSFIDDYLRNTTPSNSYKKRKM